MVTSHLFTFEVQIFILVIVRLWLSIFQYLYYIYVLTYNLSEDFFQYQEEYDGYVFCCFQIVLTNGFVKKSMKTPKNAIELAVRYKNDYIERYT